MLVKGILNIKVIALLRGMLDIKVLMLFVRVIDTIKKNL